MMFSAASANVSNALVALERVALLVVVVLISRSRCGMAT